MARPRAHLGITLVALACLGHRLTWTERLAFVGGGVLVDGDHLIDYWLQRRAGRRCLLVLPCHGWEYGLLALLCPAPGRWSHLLRAAGIGLLLHLVVDQLTNRPAHPALYAVLFRLRRRFAAERLAFRQGDGGWMQRPWWQWL